MTGLALVAGVIACGDGRPGFCDELSEQASLDDLAAALEDGDLDTAATEADELQQLAEDAPREVRPQFEALARGVADVVGLLEAEQRSGTDGTGGSGGDGTGDATADDGNVTDPADVERLRKELNERLGELGDDSSTVSAWTEENCGFSLA